MTQLRKADSLSVLKFYRIVGTRTMNLTCFATVVYVPYDGNRFCVYLTQSCLGCILHFFLIFKSNVIVRCHLRCDVMCTQVYIDGRCCKSVSIFKARNTNKHIGIEGIFIFLLLNSSVSRQPRPTYANHLTSAYTSCRLSAAISFVCPNISLPLQFLSHTVFESDTDLQEHEKYQHQNNSG